MRDNSGATEDVFSEDAAMECEGDGGTPRDHVHPDGFIPRADSSPTIRDAAERLLTLLAAEQEEDEGVELDELEEDEEEYLEEDEEEDARLLHRLAASLAEELRQSHRKQPSTRLPVSDPLDRDQRESTRPEHRLREDSFARGSNGYRDSLDKRQGYSAKQPEALDSRQHFRGSTSDNERPDHLDRRSRTSQLASSGHREQSSCWTAGWEACAAEALRYLVEDEGLPPHHPTVLALRDHLDLQRERAFARYAA